MQAFERLEREFAAWVGVPDAVACSSGTSALHLALEALQLPSYSRVLIPDFNMIAVARAVSLAGLIPVLVDCRDDLLMDMDLADEALSDDGHIRAVIAVHIYGRRCDMDSLQALAGKYGVQVIEDLAEAHGVKPHPASAAACWSFYQNKLINGQEGGLVYFRNDKPAQLARSLRCLGFTPAHDFWHKPRGMNYRMANVLAELILDSLAKVDENIRVRRHAESLYESLCPDVWRMPPRDSAWVYDIRIPGLTAERQSDIVQKLNAVGIAARHSFKPISKQQEYRRCRAIGGKVAEKASKEIVYLPLTPGTVTPESAELAFRILGESIRRG